MSEIEYHLGELEIARTPDDPRRIMPALPDSFDSILDLGCGIGQTLIMCELKPGAFACGVDVDAAALAYGKKLSPHIRFVCAQGESLPFPDHSFEVVISRVALPYMHIPSVLQEIERILTPSGYVWFALHPFTMLRDDAINAIRSGNLKSFVYVVYVLINGICFHLTGRQFRYPLNRAKCESFQTTGGISKAMDRAGFERVRAERGRSFVVSAVKRACSSFLIKVGTLCAASVV